MATAANKPVEESQKPNAEESENVTPSEPQNEEELVENLAGADSSLEKPADQEA